MEHSLLICENFPIHYNLVMNKYCITLITTEYNTPLFKCEFHIIALTITFWLGQQYSHLQAIMSINSNTCTAKGIV